MAATPKDVDRVTVWFPLRSILTVTTVSSDLLLLRPRYTKAILLIKGRSCIKVRTFDLFASPPVKAVTTTFIRLETSIVNISFFLLIPTITIFYGNRMQPDNTRPSILYRVIEMKDTVTAVVGIRASGAVRRFQTIAFP